MTTRTDIYLDLASPDDVRSVAEAVLGRRVKDADFEAQHPRYPPGNPRAGQFMDKPDLERLANSRPVSALFAKLPSRSSRYAPVDHGLGALDHIFVIPKGTNLGTVRFGGVRTDTAGRYDSLDHEVLLFDIRVDHETVVRFEGNPGSANTFVHEVGHALDVQALPQALGVKDRADEIVERNHELDRQGTEEGFVFPSGIALALERASESDAANRHPLDSAVVQFVHAAYTSPTINHLRALNDTEGPVMVRSEQLGTEIPAMPDHAYLDYLTTVPEVWARAFEQYVGERSGSEPMMVYVRAHRQATAGSALKYHHYWDEVEFAPIAAALDRLFSEIGWLAPPHDPE